MQEQKKWFEFVVRYQGDSEFASRVDADPAGQAQDFGIAIPEGAKLKVLKNTASQINLVIPQRNLNELSEEELGETTGGGHCACHACCACGSSTS